MNEAPAVLPDCAPVLHLIRPGMLGAELGCAAGKSSAAFLAAGARMILVDAWRDYKGYREDFREFGSFGDCMRAVSPFRAQPGVEVLEMFTHEAARQVEDASLDFVFVDANHEEKHVARDLADWWPKLKPGGWMLGHDWNLHQIGAPWAGVQLAVRRFAREHQIHGVTVFEPGPKGIECWGLQKP